MPDRDAPWRAHLFSSHPLAHSRHMILSRANDSPTLRICPRAHTRVAGSMVVGITLDAVVVMLIVPGLVVG